MSKNKGCAVDQSSVYTRLSVYYAWFLKTAGQQEVDNSAATTTQEPAVTNTDPVTTESVVTTVTETAGPTVTVPTIAKSNQ